MKSLILSFSLIVVALFSTRAEANTYPELATISIENAWAQFESEAEVLNDPDVLPHETKELRKRIVALREVLDLFAYSYSFSRKKDPWLGIRKNLDTAYELIGTYKDLYDIQGLEDPSEAKYKNKELKPIRDEVLAWWDDWNQSSSKIYDYLTNPATDQIYERSKSELSKFYWGASDLVPNLEISGEENLALLSVDLLKSAINSWPEVREIKTPVSSLKMENKFHDFRKRLRSVARILRAYPEMYDGTEEDLIALETLSDQYGFVNDKILVYHKAVENKKDKKADELKKEIKEEWKALVDEQDYFVLDLLQNVLNATHPEIF